MKHRTLHLAILGCLLASLTAHAAPAVSAADGPPLTGAAWTAADLAYRAYAKGDYAGALRHVKVALKLRPDLARLRALQGYAEEKQRQRPQPDAARQLNSQAAMQAATLSLRSEADGDMAGALAAIRSALANDPEAPQYRLMLIKLLDDAGDTAGAWTAAQLALSIHSDDAMTQTWAAFLLQQRGQRDKALPLYQQALASDDLGDADLRNLRLIAADAALAASDSPVALQALAPLPESDADARERRTLARFIADGSIAFRPALTAPRMRCIVNRFGPVCSLFAGARPSQLLAAAAYREQNDQHLRAALQLVDDALRVGGASPEQVAQRKQVQASMGRAQAALAFQALANRDTAKARQALQQAIADAPDVMAYRMMLIDADVQEPDDAAAEREASAAMATDPGDATPQIMRGYVRQARGDFTGARSDYTAALARGLGDSDGLGASLYVADALMAGGEAAAADRILAQLPAADPQVGWRRRLAGASGPRPALHAPGLDYRTTPYDTAVVITPSPYAADALVAAIFRAMSSRDNANAVALARLLSASAPDNANYQRVFATALTEAGATGEARAARDKAGNGAPSLDYAYLAQRAEAPQMAAAAFREIDQAGALPNRALQDAGYAAMNANEPRTASAYFKRAIDAAHNRDPALDDQQLFGVRRTVEQLEREWGGYASLSYRGASPQSNPAGATSSDSAQIGAEGYWRPTELNRDGRYVDLYARISANAYSRDDGIATGAGSALGALGVRVKPFTSQNLILAAERVVPLGSRTAGDWLLRAAYSAGTGTDLQAQAGQWTMAQVYAEAGRYLGAGTTYVTSESQLGRSFLAADGGHIVWTPYLVLGADYNQGFLQREAVGAGVGLSWRYWYSEDRYTAPRGYVDLTVQYRARISGDDRAGGVVLRAVVTR